MKKVGRYLWLLFVLVIAASVIVFKWDNFRGFLQHLMASFHQRPLISQIIIGVVVWLVAVIVPYLVYAYLSQDSDADDEARVLVFVVLWPPAWPIALLLWLLWRR